MRTHLCGNINESLAGQTVTLCGWVARARDLGGLIFIGLRDHAGVLQVIVEPDNTEAFKVAESLRNEFVICVTGRVRLRPESQWNPDMRTGKVELLADSVEVLNAAAPLPLLMNDDDGEEVRLKYRYLDLRRDRMQNNLRLRSKLTRAIRRYLEDHDFLDMETPILTKATPGGCAGLFRAEPSPSRAVFRSSSVAPDLQAAADDERHGSLLSDRALLPG